MNDFLKPDLGATILRVTLGTVLIAHSLYLKLIVFTLPGTAAFFVSIGLPEVMAYVVFAIEAIAGIALILGFRTRWFAALAIPVLLGATWVHMGNGWLFSSPNGGWEYPLFLTIAAIVQVSLGDGRYAIKTAHG